MMSGKLIAKCSTVALSGTARPISNTSLRSLFITCKQQKHKNDDASSTTVQKAVRDKEPAIPVRELDQLQELRPARALLYPDQMEWLDDRLARISKPTKNVMQSGTAYTNCWKVEFDSQPRNEYWLMGWTGTTDPMSNMTITFPSKESAIEFCERNQLQWFLEEQPERKVRKKSYADNFSWNKRTRLGSK